EVVYIEVPPPRELHADDEARDADDLAARFEVRDSIARLLLSLDLRDQCFLRERAAQLEEHAANPRQLDVGLGDLDVHRSGAPPPRPAPEANDRCGYYQRRSARGSPPTRRSPPIAIIASDAARDRAQVPAEVRRLACRGDAFGAHDPRLHRGRRPCVRPRPG